MKMRSLDPYDDRASKDSPFSFIYGFQARFTMGVHK